MKLLKNSMSLLPIQNLANFFEVSKSYIKAPELRKENMPILKPYPFLRYVTADKNLAFKVTSSILICHNNRRCHNMRWDLYHCDPTQRGFLSQDPFGREKGGGARRVIEVKDHPFLLSPRSPARERGGHKKRKGGRRWEGGEVTLEVLVGTVAVSDVGAHLVQDLGKDCNHQLSC